MRLLIFRMMLGLHILLAITWVGGILFVGWGVYLAFRRFSMQAQREIYRVLMHHAHWLFTVAGSGVVITGVLLGTWLGPIHSLQDIWGSDFGREWLVALVSGIFTLIWGTIISYPHTMRVLADDNWISIAIVEFVEILGFLVMIGCMVLFIT